MNPDRIQALSSALEREKMRREALAERVARRDEAVEESLSTLRNRIERLEVKVLIWAMGGAAGGALVGSAGTAAARTFLGG